MFVFYLISCIRKIPIPTPRRVFGNLMGEGDIEAKLFKGKVLTKTGISRGSKIVLFMLVTPCYKI